MHLASEDVFDRIRLGGMLESGVREMNLRLPNAALARCLDHLGLLAQWNCKINLTAIREPEEMIVKHVLDSLAASAFIRGRRALDLGSGAGFPGLVLAIAQPEREWVLLDASLKKIQFLRHAIAALGIGNVQAVHARADQYEPQDRFDTVACRALGSLKAAAELARPLIRADGILVALKGRRPDRELVELPDSCSAAVRRVHPPGLTQTRHIITLTFDFGLDSKNAAV